MAKRLPDWTRTAGSAKSRADLNRAAFRGGLRRPCLPPVLRVSNEPTADRSHRQRYGDVQVVKSVSLAIEEGEFVSLLGPSGCGKTTILRMVAGLIEPTSGTIKVGERDITQLPPNKRQMGLVFQSYALFPHLTVFENVAFGLRRQGAEWCRAGKAGARSLEHGAP